jgi:parallel beta-helix repeat protein
MSKRLFGLFVSLLVISGVNFFTEFAAENARGAIVTVDDDGGAMFTSIQLAIDSANIGDTIYVYNGTYHENLIVGKQVNLVGEDQELTIINGSFANDTIFVDNTDIVTITGFTITGGNHSGIYINWSNSVLVAGNIIVKNHNGITLNFSNGATIARNRIQNNEYLADLFYTLRPPWHVGYGVYLNYSSDDRIVENNMSFNGYVLCDEFVPGCILWEAWGGGIQLDTSDDNIISSNDIFSNFYYTPPLSFEGNGAGIGLSSSSNNTIANNNLAGNTQNIELKYSDLNNAFGNRIYYPNNLPVSPSSNIAGVSIEYGSNNTISLNSVDRVSTGISVGFESNFNEIIGNQVSNASWGVYLYSNDTLVTNNTVRNSQYGMDLYEASNTTIVNNIVVGIGNLNTYGIYLNSGIKVTNNTIVDNTISDFDYGVFLLDNRNNTLSRNNITSNNNGIKIQTSAPANYSYNNTIHHNNFVGNTIQAIDLDFDNKWNSSYPPDGIGGNYWSDYSPACQDLFNGSSTPQASGSPDGFCDNPYSIDGDSRDYYALTSAATDAGSLLLPDITPPARITDLTAINSTLTSVALRWTAPGNDGIIGMASQYDLRYSTLPVNDTNWGMATQVIGETQPKIGGKTEVFEVQGLALDTTYFFAIKTADGGPNWSLLSNIVMARTLQDLTAPIIAGLKTEPNPQSVYDNVNISAIVSDNYQLSNVWINLTYPDGLFINQTMDNTGALYHFNQSYNSIGTYNFTIWAKDTPDNWASSDGQFLIYDIEVPSIVNPIALPYPQEVYGFVNISATVIDNYDTPGVSLNITGPDGSWQNVTMVRMGAVYFYNQPYDQVGIYQFIIWANDTSVNWNNSAGDIEIIDSTPPTANAGNDKEVPQGSLIILDGNASSDNYLIVNYTWSFLDNVPIVLYGDNPGYVFNNIGNFEIVLTIEDSFGNSDVDKVWINVTDVTRPGISGFAITPNPQEVYGNVNITSIIDDNHDLPTAFVNITRPGGLWENMTMAYVGTTYYHDENYDTLGIYSFIIWANDSAGNYNYATGSFEIVDSTHPSADAGDDQILQQGNILTFNGNLSWDNIGISNYSWFFVDLEPVELYGEKPSYAFNRLGNYIVILAVKDSSGNTAIDQLWVNVTSFMSPTGIVTGIVVDSEGNPIEGATVRLLKSGIEVSSARSSLTGEYTFSNISLGAYTIEVTKNTQMATSPEFTIDVDNLNIRLVTVLDLEALSSREAIPVWSWFLIAILAVAVIFLLVLLYKQMDLQEEENSEKEVEQEEDVAKAEESDDENG